MSFAAGVGTALMVSRLHRRRRHRTPRSGPDLNAREPEPGPAVRKLRRVALAAREGGHTDGEPEPSAQQRLHLFPLTSNGQIVLGVRDDQETSAPIGGLVVGLSGPGGLAAARALLLTLLMHAGDHDVELVVSRDDASRLLTLPSEDVDELAQHVPAVRLTPDLNAALRLLESERIHRARLLDTTADGQDLDAVRGGDPTEPLPRLVLLATPSEDQQRRLQALATAASEYDMAIITLGDHPAGPTVLLDDSGHVTATRGTNTELWEGLQLFHLSVDDTRQVLDLLRSAHGAPEPERTSEQSVEATGPIHVPSPRPAPPVRQDAGAAGEQPVQLRVLGHPTVLVGDQELETGIRGKGRELLTYLAVHADGASRDAITAALWPDVDHKHAVMRFHALLHDSRRALKRATRLVDENFIVLSADRYRLNPELVGVDLWRFHTALHRASQADDDQIQAALLQQAADTYVGHLAAEGSYEQAYEWIEPEREALRRQAVEALVHLATLYERQDSERALVVLERARTLDRYAEEIYQRIMTLQAKLGRPDAVRRTFRLLETSLEDLAVDPSEETQQLLWRLLHPRGRQPQPDHRQKTT
ncbi:hypothetical protein GCM10022214_78210 [Actinomadura miaoliensis]|uniref:Bacterial transcriptional activator domain-containing protein n=1 Tax=Actinomadura miaoliensis TaxID=430685 RepID=A0ABP7X018_9ACTN